MYRSDCKDCKNQDVKVYILYKALALDRSKAASILKSLPLVVNLSNGKDRTEKIHTFHFEPKTRKFSIVLQSAGSCTLIKDITVSYSVCDKNVSSLANLPRTVAPANGSKRVNFSCPDKSVNPDGKEVYGLCSSEGLWKIISPCTPKKGNASSVEGKGIGKLKSVLSWSENNLSCRNLLCPHFIKRPFQLFIFAQWPCFLVKHLLKLVRRDELRLCYRA